MRSSAVVVACRPHQWLRPCLESILDQADEVVVVDNGSPDGWAEREARSVGARTVRLGRNLGFPAGVNRGLRAATGDLVALLNHDAMARPGWVKAAAETLADPTVAAVAPQLLLAAPHLEVRFDDDPWYAPGDPRPLGRQLHSATVDTRCAPGPGRWRPRL